MNFQYKARLFLGKIFKKCSDLLMADIYSYELFKANCRKAGYSPKDTKDNKITLTTPAYNTIYLRKNTSDIAVFNQIMIQREYQPIIELISRNEIQINNIIDCGANIGLASLFFYNILKPAKIIAVEADYHNFLALKQNTQNNKNIKIFHNAIWHEQSTLTLDRSFRDQKEWSISVQKQISREGVKVQAVTINDIITTENLGSIDFLKVDIEGSEKEIFTNPQTCLFLNHTKVIAIEIHDEFNIRKDIEKTLKHYDFIGLSINETTFAFKRNLLK